MIVLWKAYDGGAPYPLDGPAIAIAAVLAAWLTQRLLENPVRRGAITRSTVRGLAVVVVTVVPVALASLYLDARPSLQPTTINAAHAGAQMVAAAAEPDGVHVDGTEAVHGAAVAAGIGSPHRPEPDVAEVIPSLATVGSDYAVDRYPTARPACIRPG